MKRILSVLCLVILFASCTVKLVPTRDTNMISQVGAASNMTAALYDEIIASSDRSFPTYESEYQNVQNAIDNIVVQDATRDKAKVVLKIATDIKNRFANYTAQHKAETNLNDAQLRTFKNYMQALWSALYNAESSYK